MRKRGLSEIVTTILIVLVAIAAVIIAWSIIKYMIEKQDTDPGLITSDLDIKKAEASGNLIIISLKRNAGAGNIAGLKFVFENKTKTYVYTYNSGINELEERTISIDLTGNLSNATKVEVYPIILSQKGNNLTGPKKDTYTFNGEELASQPDIQENYEIVLTGSRITEDGHIEARPNKLPNEWIRDNASSYAYIGVARDAGSLPPFKYARAYFEFNTSSIPDNAAINNIFFNISVQAAYTGTSCSIYSMENQPSTSSNQTIFNDAGDGIFYNSSGLWCKSAGWKLINITNAKSNLQDNLALGWFAIGIKSAEDESPVLFTFTSSIYTAESANNPELIVNYTS